MLLPTARVVLAPALIAALCVSGCDDPGTVDASDALMAKETPPSDGGWCGDGEANGDEECDYEDLGGADCAYLGFGDGLLRCGVACTYDTALCLGNGVCGNGVVDGDDECDDGDVLVTDCPYGQRECEVCTADCTVGAGAPHFCGDDVLDDLEQCDGALLGDTDCVSLGYDGGDLGCGTDCRVDTSSCAGSVCGNGVVDDGEECDDGDDNTSECEYGLESCQVCRPDCVYGEGASHVCGDGVIDAANGEPCDGDALGGATCESQGFAAGGVLACQLVDDGQGRRRCFFDTRGCETGVTSSTGGGGGGCAVVSLRPPRAGLVLAAAVAAVAVASRRDRPRRTTGGLR